MDVGEVPAARWAEARAGSASVAAAWRRRPAMRRLEAVFDDAAAASLPLALDRAAALFADGGWIAELLDPLVDALAADPLFDPPVKASRDRTRTGAVLFDGPGARVSATLVSAAALAAVPPPPSVVVTGHVAVTRYVRSGGATLRRWRAEPLTADFSARTAALAVEIEAIAPRDGAVVVHDGRREGHLLAGAARDVVTVTAILRAGQAPLMREYATADGALLRAATTDDAASRASMLLTLLRASGRADAGEAFAAATREPAFHLRWSAMREWLALDARAALPRLAEMAADDANAEVRSAAAATLGMVRHRMAAACPA